MSLRPDLRQPLLIAWASLGGTVLVCAGLLWWLTDPGELPDQLAKAKKEATVGKVDLAKRIQQSKEAVKHLGTTIEGLKQATGFTPSGIFLVPKEHSQPGQYFNEVKAGVQDNLRKMAETKSVTYQENLGFDGSSKVPKNEDAPYLLAMLQLTEKAASTVLKTQTPIEWFAITQPVKYAEITGPDGRPPLLREYTLKIEVRAGLTDILWILHALAQIDRTDDYPLVIRRFTIDSQNLKPTDGIQQHTAVIEVAAMSFLSPDERTKVLATPKRGSGLGGTSR